MFTLRDARPADLPDIDRIYDHYVQHSTCTAQLEPAGLAAREAWFAQHGPKHPIVVAEEDGTVMGWASLSVFNVRAGYATTVEDSIYIDAARRGQGMGSVLLGHVVDRARELGHRAIIAGIAGDQPVSRKLHARHGFVEVGRLRDVFYKHGVWLDVVYMQRTA